MDEGDHDTNHGTEKESIKEGMETIMKGTVEYTLKDTIKDTIPHFIPETPLPPTIHTTNIPSNLPATNIPSNLPSSPDETPHSLFSLLCHPRGTHVLQRIMRTFPPAQWTPLYHSLRRNARRLAGDRNGSMALRLALDILDSPRGRPLALQLAADAPALSRHPVGNYVVQHLLSRPAGDTWREEVFAEVVRGLRGSFVELSKQKYSSNVVERAVADSAVAGRREVFEELLRVSAIVQLLDNHFGTYVLQKTMQAIHPEERRRVDMEVRKSESMLGTRGNCLLAKWKLIMSRCA
ncbi:hypothetical protein WA588_004191 [Blastocystis sp. NMH]